MQHNLEDHDDPTLFTPPHSRKAIKATTKTLTIPENLNPAEVRQFLGSAFFNEHATLMLHIASVSQPIVFSPAPQTILGRIEPEHSDVLYLNLASFGAREEGVSRKHAVFYRSDVTLGIQDLDSKNGTYLNGYRLPAHEIQILRDRDELILGNLRIRIAFQYGATE